VRIVLRSRLLCRLIADTDQPRSKRVNLLLNPIIRLLGPARVDPFAFALLAVGAVGVLVAGVQHERLFHRGYAEVHIVGPLFLLNGIGSVVVVLALVLRRPWIFVLGALSICGPSLISIAISHTAGGFFGFREGGYDPDALVIVVGEVVAMVFTMMGAIAAAAAIRRPADADVDA